MDLWQSWRMYIANEPFNLIRLKINEKKEKRKKQMRGKAKKLIQIRVTIKRKKLMCMVHVYFTYGDTICVYYLRPYEIV